MSDQSRPFLYLLVGLASFFIIIAGIRDLAFILNPILLSIVITITVLPLPVWLSRRGMRGWQTLVLTLVTVLAAIGLMMLLVFVGLAQLRDALPIIQARVREQAAVVTSAEPGNDPLEAVLGISLAELRQAISDLLTSERLASLATGLLNALFTGVSQALLVILIFAFMLSSALTLSGGARVNLRPDHPLVQRASELTASVRQYVTLTTLINLLVGLGNTILLLILGVDLALLWGLLSWFMGYIPAIGFWIAMLPPLILAYVQYGFGIALIVLLGYVIINGSVENLFKPRLMGQRLKISPVVVVISLFVWGWLLGGVGAVLSIPLTLLTLSILEMFESTRWVAVILRMTGEEDTGAKGERQEAFGRVREMWDRMIASVRGAPPGP